MAFIILHLIHRLVEFALPLEGLNFSREQVVVEVGSTLIPLQTDFSLAFPILLIDLIFEKSGEVGEEGGLSHLLEVELLCSLILLHDGLREVVGEVNSLEVVVYGLSLFII